jgi:thiol:disulfide interchange protein
MPIKTIKIISVFLILFLAPSVDAVTPQDALRRSESPSSNSWTEIARYENEFSRARLEPAEYEGRKGVAVVFKGTEDLHYYARPETTLAPGYELKFEPQSSSLSFGKPVFPKWKIFKDPTGIDVEVYTGDFTVFIPFSKQDVSTITGPVETKVTITGLACTSKLCLPPFEKALQLRFDYNNKASFIPVDIEKAGPKAVSGAARLNYPVWYALGLALLAGLSLNIMPCVWPVLPLVVLRIAQQGQGKIGRKITMGLAFAIGIILFFACLAAANIVLHLVYHETLEWGDQFRSTNFVIVMALVLVALAMFMFDVFTVSVPASVSGRATSGKGYLGTVGMGFLAAILSTPCSFGILAAAFAWAQGQPLFPATIAILCIGLGMGIPYIILTSIPGLLEKLPKPGRWMDIFKKFVGFVLVAVAAWMITIVPQDRRSGVFYFAVVLAFCLWMWGGWVGFGSKLHNKIIVRVLAISLAVAAGFYLLKPHAKLIDWQSYDTGRIDLALSEARPVLIDFTADWCLSCKAVDIFVYSREDVAELIEEKNVLAVKADTTYKDNPATSALANVYNEPGVPVSILLLPNGEDVRWQGKAFADELVEQLKKLPLKNK